ncbi:VOC family protein [Nakamurella sp. PAMC28650]|uniref:VOC family protein n=1 Tax=Nakamurella sp. PAMC28650 TaxID=2762325 RepID=UPI00164D3841|nr:VOC family protein [Nakamurella sp. PAMC28650]QNK82019.1 VOC family protein [Nakamurella sp. PAMC28650]
MAIISSSGYAHVRLTVTDIERSKAFYQMVFGWPIAIDNSARVDEPGVKESAGEFYGGVVFQTPSGALFGLRPVAPSGQKFQAEHTGLDHVSFMVSSREDLVIAEQGLADADIEHGEIIDLTDAGLAILSFQDPDGVNLELTALLS